jgi:hypothetical protein
MGYNPYTGQVFPDWDRNQGDRAGCGGCGTLLFWIVVILIVIAIL